MTGVQTCALPICFPVTIPGARVFVDDKLIDEYFIAPYKSSFENDRKVLLRTLLYPTNRKEIDNLFFKNMPLLKFYEINIDSEQNKLNLLIEIDNNDNNYNNGFLSKSTLVQLKVCYFFPLHKKLLERFNKKMSKNTTGRNYAWTRRQTNTLFDLVKNGMEWHGKNKQIFKSKSNFELNFMSIGGDGYFSCNLEKNMEFL